MADVNILIMYRLPDRIACALISGLMVVVQRTLSMYTYKCVTGPISHSLLTVLCKYSLYLKWLGV
jgi:hypothetical protein